MPNEVQRLCGRVVFNALDLSPICVGLVARAVDQQHHVRLRLLARGSTLPSWMLAQVSRALVALVDGMALENIEDVGGVAGLVRADDHAEGDNLIDLAHVVKGTA